MSYAVTAAVVSAVISGVSTGIAASNQQDALEYQSKVAENNAKIAAWQRSDALQRGEIEAQAAMRKQNELIGKQRALLSASGVDATQGSALDVLASTRFLGQQDVATIQSNAAREAWGYEVQGSNFKAQALLDKSQASNINPAMQGTLAAGTSLLSSASSYAGAGGFKGGTGGGSSATMKFRPGGGW